MLWQEAQLVRERINGRIVTDTLMLNAVISAHMSTGDEARDHLNKLIKGLQNGR